MAPIGAGNPSTWRRLARAGLLAALALARAAAAPDLERDRVVALEGLFLREGPSVPLSAAYRSLPEPARLALLEKVRQMVLAHLPPGFEQKPELAALPPEARAAIQRLLPLLQAVTPARLDAFVQTQDLDHLAPLPPAVFQAYHVRSMATPVPGGTQPRAALAAAHRAAPETWKAAAQAAPGYLLVKEAPPAELVLLGPTDAVPPEEVPHDSVAPGPGGLGANPSYPLEVPPWVLANSKRLARALDHLTNVSYREHPLAVRLPGRTGKARDGVELINQLVACKAYDLAVYDARMFVNFIDLWMPHGDTLLPVRLPTWIATGIDPDAPETSASKGLGVVVPANHSEHLLVLFERGTMKPAALVRWYIGIPSADASQGAMWRPAIDQRASWSGYRIVRAYPDSIHARQLVRDADRLMHLFNFLQSSYQLDANGYGELGVCNDTSGLLEAALQGRTGAITVWPLFRDPDLDFYYAGVLEELGLRMQKADDGARILDVPSDARPDRYPWLADRHSLLLRVGANVPSRDLATMHFPDLRATLEKLRQASPAFARGLGLLSISGR